MRVLVTQSNFLPWRGWFAMLARADAWVVLDSVQFTRRDWRSRNRIRTDAGTAWISLPVESAGRFHQPVDRVRIADARWAEALVARLSAAYRRAPHAPTELPWIAGLLRGVAGEPMLSAVNVALTVALAARLGVARPVLRDVDLLPRDALGAMDASERLAALAAAAGGTRYLTGPAARAYLDPAPFAKRGIAVDWMDYGGLPPYPQCHGGWEPAVSVADMLLNGGMVGATGIEPVTPAV